MSLSGKLNAWIKPSGQFIAVGFMDHNEWAYGYFQEKYGPMDYLDKIDEINKSRLSSYPYSALHNLGWVRLLTWSDNKTKVLGDCVSNDGRLDTMDPALTNKQKETLHEWCMDNNFIYENLFKL